MSIILVGTDNRCLCSCGVKCVNGKVGSEARCTRSELTAAGYRTVAISDSKSQAEIGKATTVDGHVHTIKVKDVTSRCIICDGYGVFNGCSECGKISNPIYGHD